MNWHKEAEEIEQRRKLAKAQGGAESIARHHAKGRLTIRERIDALVAPNSFEEHGEGAGFAEKDENGEIKEHGNEANEGNENVENPKIMKIILNKKHCF